MPTTARGLATREKILRAAEICFAELGYSRTSVAEVVRRVHPTILIGTSTRANAFTEEIVSEMATHVDRPVILPMSNPTHLCEAVPADLIRWTGGRALVATGSPFDPITYDKVTHVIGQANNALVFPGLGLGAIVARASVITDGMIVAAAAAIADLVDPTTPGASLLPQIEDLRDTSVAVAVAVADAARREGVARAALDDDLEGQVRDAVWTPGYLPVRAAEMTTGPLRSPPTSGPEDRGRTTVSPGRRSRVSPRSARRCDPGSTWARLPHVDHPVEPSLRTGRDGSRSRTVAGDASGAQGGDARG